MANPIQEIIVISTNESDSDNEDEVVVNMELSNVATNNFLNILDVHYI